MKSFLHAKNEFDKEYLLRQEVKAIIPVHLNLNQNSSVKNKKNEPNEEYYKWQFFYSLIKSGLYQKDFIGCEVYFPKGNKNSAPIKLDGAIFDDLNWFD